MAKSEIKYLFILILHFNVFLYPNSKFRYFAISLFAISLFAISLFRYFAFILRSLPDLSTTASAPPRQTPWAAA